MRHSVAIWLSVLQGLMFCALPNSLSAQTFDYGLEVQGGDVLLKSEKSTEIDKDGTASAASVIARRPAWKGFYHFGLGIQSSKVSGEDKAAGFKKQDFATQLAFVDMRYIYALPAHFEIGLALRNLYGDGAKYDVQSVDAASYVLAMAPILGYTRQYGQWTTGINLSYYVDVNIPDRNVQTPLAGVFVTYKFEKKKEEEKKAAPPPPQPPKAEPVPEPAPAPELPPTPVLVSLGSKLVNFDLDSSRIKDESMPRVEALAKVLARIGAPLGNIHVAGHTDSRGSLGWNEQLSKARAQAVCDVFIKAGVPATQLTCQGYAYHEHLPQFGPKAPEQRRVELRFKDISEEYAKELKQILEESLKQ
ncbi:MAG: OmpA family protein [Oligoflexales bacterium]